MIHCLFRNNSLGLGNCWRVQGSRRCLEDTCDYYCYYYIIIINVVVVISIISVIVVHSEKQHDNMPIG